jgi:hypothetical protein
MRFNSGMTGHGDGKPVRYRLPFVVTPDGRIDLQPVETTVERAIKPINDQLEHIRPAVVANMQRWQEYLNRLRR